MSGAYLLGSSPPVFSSYSTNLYNLTLEMVESRGANPKRIVGEIGKKKGGNRQKKKKKKRKQQTTTLYLPKFILPPKRGGGGGGEHLILCPPPEKTWGGGGGGTRPPGPPPPPPGFAPMVERRQLHMHTRNFIFLFFRLLNLRGATAPIAPLATPLSTVIFFFLICGPQC